MRTDDIQVQWKLRWKTGMQAMDISKAPCIGFYPEAHFHLKLSAKKNTSEGNQFCDIPLLPKCVGEANSRSGKSDFANVNEIDNRLH